MVRVLRFSTHRVVSGAEAREARAIAREAAAAAQRLPGIRYCIPYLDPEVLVFTTEFGCCRDAQAALEAPAVEAALARLSAKFGYVMCEDEFSLDVGDVAAKSEVAEASRRS